MNDFSFFFKHNPVPTFLWKKDKMENCNPAAVKFFGAKTEKELISQDIFKRIDSKVFYAVLNKTSRDNHSSAELTIPKYKSKFTIKASKLVGEEGYLIRIVKIDEMTKSPPSENRFQTIVESSHDAIMRFDRQHRHLYVNSVVEEQTKIPVVDFIGKTHDELGFPKHLCELWGHALDKVFESGDYHRVEFTLPNDIYIDWSLVPELDEHYYSEPH